MKPREVWEPAISGQLVRKGQKDRATCCAFIGEKIQRIAFLSADQQVRHTVTGEVPIQHTMSSGMLDPCLVSWESFFSEGPAIAGLAEANLPATTKLKLAPVAHWKSKAIDVSTTFTLYGGIAVIF